MKISILLSVLALSATSEAFAPSASFKSRGKVSSHIQTHHVPSFDVYRSKNIQHFTALSVKTGDEESEGILAGINPVYAIPYAIFLTCATYFSLNEPAGASQAIIEKFVENPLQPNLGSSLFEVVFNSLGLVGVPMACLIMPGAKDQKLNPVPFLFGSAAAGYGSLGIFMMTRKPREEVDMEDLGWFTKNVLENKIFNWIVVLALANVYNITGAGADLISDAGATFAAFKDFIGQSALGFVSTVDLTILCLTGASLVPEDLKRRGVDDQAKAATIAASTLLVPVVGLATYAALRPSLEEE